MLEQIDNIKKKWRSADAEIVKAGITEVLDGSGDSHLSP